MASKRVTFVDSASTGAGKPSTPAAWRRALAWLGAEERQPYLSALAKLVGFGVGIVIIRKYGDQLVMPQWDEGLPSSTPQGSMPPTLDSALPATLA